MGNCFTTIPVDSPTLTAVIEYSDGPDWFVASRNAGASGELFPYYDGHDGITSTANHDLMTLQRGYAPFGVMFDGSNSTSRDSIKNWHWKLFDTDGTTVLKEYDAFTAAYVYETSGSYNVELEVSDVSVVEIKEGITFTAPDKINDANNGLAVFTAGNTIRVIGRSGNVGEYTISTVTAGQIVTTETSITTEASTKNTEIVSTDAADTDTATTTVSVWARDGNTYYVDSAIGDDNNSGLSGSPWKTATRAFDELSPHEVNVGAGSAHTIADYAGASTVETVRRYSAGTFKLYRGRNDFAANYSKDKNGLPLPEFNVTTYTSKNIDRVIPSVYGAGDSVLFNRGQTFDIESSIPYIRSYQATVGVTVYNYEILDSNQLLQSSNKSGVHFGAYGSGAKPVIKNKEVLSKEALLIFNNSFAQSLVDLEFDCESGYSNLTLTRPAYGNRAIFAVTKGTSVNQTFKRLEINRMEQGVLANGGSSDLGVRQDGTFVFDCAFYESNVVHMYTAPANKNVAIVDNTFDLSGNHLIYSCIDKGLVYGNTLSRPAFGRTAYRQSGTDIAVPAQDVYFANNDVVGWQDPRTLSIHGREFGDGDAWNFQIVDFTPNTGSSGETTKAIKYCTITNNVITGWEKAISISNTEKLKAYNNDMSTATEGGHAFPMDATSTSRPLKDIDIYANTVEFTAVSSGSDEGSFIKFENYHGQVCDDLANHSNVNVYDNLYKVNDILHYYASCYSTEVENPLGTVPRPRLTLDQQETELAGFLTMTNNEIQTPHIDAAMIYIGQSNYPQSPTTCTAGDYLTHCDLLSLTNDAELGYQLPIRFYNSTSPFYTTLMSGTTITYVP